nr:reverse transcriptase domain-containing protein [Tanacetum cinerariifolium]
MRTRSNLYPSNSTATIPRHSIRRRIPNIVEPEIRTIAEIVSMADRTMEELLQAPTEGYGEAIVILETLAENFEIKTNFLQLVQANKFHGFERDNPHTHISNFKRMTATLKYRDVSNDVIKLMLFLYSLEGATKVWYEKEPPNSILTWDDLVNKFVNQLFPHSKTTHLKNEISRFTQRFEETFSEAWEHFKDLLRACPHHRFSKLTQIDTFYNGLTEQDQDSLNAASGGNLLNKTTREALKIIENKSKLRYSRSQSNISNFVEIVNKQVIALGKAVEKTCVTCGGAHAYYECIATDSNPSSVYAATGSCNQVFPPNRASNQIPPPGFAPVQNNPNRDGELTPIRITLELADRSITRPKGFAEDVFVKVGKFHFPTNFVVVDFEADPRVPLIGRSFLRTGGALIDVYGEKITLRVNEESITFNLNQTMRYSSTYDDTTVNRVDFIDIACEDFMQDVLDFQYNPKSGSPTLVFDDLISESDSCKEPIVKTSSPTLAPFRESEFFLEEIKDFLNDDSIPTEIENSVYDPEGDILFLEKLLNEDPFQLPPMDLKLAEESKEKYSVEEPLELELKELPSHLNYAFLEDSNKLPKISDIKGIDPRFCTHKILMEDDYIPAVQSQRKVNPKIHDVIKKEVIKLLDADMIYPISDSPWVSLIHCVPKKGGMTVVANENNELIPTRLVTGTFQRCMMSIFHDMIEKTIEVFMDNFSIFRDSFSSCLTNLDNMLNRCEETNLVLNWEKCHFRCREGIVLGHKISMSGIEVDRVKVDVIAKLPHPTTIKGVRSLLGHVGFYRRFIQDFSKISRPMTHLLKKDTPFFFSKECIDAFNTLKKKLTEAPILVVPDWNLPFELMCDASDYAIGAVLGQCKSKHFQPIHYASETMTEA